MGGLCWVCSINTLVLSPISILKVSPRIGLKGFVIKTDRCSVAKKNFVVLKLNKSTNLSFSKGSSTHAALSRKIGAYPSSKAILNKIRFTFEEVFFYRKLSQVKKHSLSKAL